MSFLIVLKGLPTSNTCFKLSIIANSHGKLDRLLFDTSNRSNNWRFLIVDGRLINWLSLKLNITNETKLSNEFSLISDILLNY